MHSDDRILHIWHRSTSVRVGSCGSAVDRRVLTIRRVRISYEQTCTERIGCTDPGVRNMYGLKTVLLRSIRAKIRSIRERFANNTKHLSVAAAAAAAVCKAASSVCVDLLLCADVGVPVEVEVSQNASVINRPSLCMAFVSHDTLLRATAAAAL